MKSYPTMTLDEAQASFSNVEVIATLFQRGNPLVAFDNGSTLVVGQENGFFRAVWLKTRTAQEVDVNQDVRHVDPVWACPNEAYRLYWDSLKAQGYEIREVEPQKVWEVDLPKATLAFTVDSTSISVAELGPGVTRFELAASNCDLNQDLGEWLGD